MQILDRINDINDIKKIDASEYEDLAAEIRGFLVEHVSKTGGHLASNLGAVELTMALHLALEFPKDKLIFDVGHQAYTHKILSGRKKEFDSLRQFEGLAGFPKRKESEVDVFDTGHSSTSISVALGLAEARQLRGGDERIVAVIGDGSFSGGMAFEALNNMSHMKSNLLVILNDNEMSISENVGAMSKYLNKIRVGHAYNDFKSGVEQTLLSIPKAGKRIASKVKRSKDSIKQLFVPGKFFEEMGITYIGPVDGHNIEELYETITAALKLNRPILVHVKTVKGKGYPYAEKHPDYFHGISPFNVETGKVLVKSQNPSYTTVFGKKMVELARENRDIVAITAAMADGTGLKLFRKQFPNRFFDVGIAEQHAVTFAAGLATAGMLPIVAIYSSFLQRAYDQILHDVCLQKLHVIFAVDRAGLVGADGETHQGIFDLSYLSELPNMTVMAPKNRYELENMMDYALTLDGPVAIRYPRGEAYDELKHAIRFLDKGKCEVLEEGSRIAILAVGSMLKEANQVAERLKAQGYTPTLINARFVKPFDSSAFASLMETHELLVTMEENVLEGGFGQAVASLLLEQDYSFGWLPVAIKDRFVPQGSRTELLKMMKMDAESVTKQILARMN